MQIQLSSPISRSATIGAFEIASITDKPGDRLVTAEVAIEAVGPVTLTLWEADAYDTIGQWTDSDAQARVEQLIIERYANS
jgi:hypothetical protein